MRLRALVVIYVLLASHARSAVADDTDRARVRAIELYRAGKSAFEARRFRDALAAFMDSYALAPAPQMLFNIARCHDELGELDAALAEYRRYRTIAAPGDQNDAAERVADVEARLLLPRRAPPNEPKPIVKRWWPWTILGVGVAGLAVGLGVGLTVGRRDSEPFAPLNLSLR